MTEERIPQHIARLIHIEGFIDAVVERYSDYETYEDAYESVERTYEYHFGKRRYSEYASFANAQSNYRKRQRR